MKHVITVSEQLTFQLGSYTSAIKYTICQGCFAMVAEVLYLFLFRNMVNYSSQALPWPVQDFIFIDRYFPLKLYQSDSI